MKMSLHVHFFFIIIRTGFLSEGCSRSERRWTETQNVAHLCLGITENKYSSSTYFSLV